MRTLAGKLLSLLCSGFALQTAAGPDLDVTLTVLAEYSRGDVDRRAANNPGNNIFNLSTDRYRLDFRPTLSAEWSSLALSMDPRFSIDRQDFDDDAEEITDAALRYWQVEWRHKDFAVRGGRYLQLWGPSVIVSPTSRYHPDNGSVRPTVELLARDYLEASYYFSPAWELQVIANIGEGEQEIDDFRSTGDLRLRWTGNSISVDAQASWLHPEWAWGLTAQWTLNDAWIIYGETLYGRDESLPQSLLRPVCGTSYPDEEVCDLHSAEERLANKQAKTVVGASYTFNRGLNLALDYYYNGAGLEESESRSLLGEAIDSSSRIIAAQASESDIGLVAGASQIPFLQLSRNYLVGRLSSQSLYKDLEGSLIYINNLDDHSSQLTLNLECQCHDSVSFFFNATIYSGAADTEYGRFYDGLWQIGVKWFY